MTHPPDEIRIPDRVHGEDEVGALIVGKPDRMRCLVRGDITDCFAHQLIGEARAPITFVARGGRDLREQLPPHALGNRFVHVRVRAKHLAASRVHDIPARVGRANRSRHVPNYGVARVEK